MCFGVDSLFTLAQSSCGQQCCSKLTGILADFDALRVELTRDYDGEGFKVNFLSTLVQNGSGQQSYS